MIYAATAVHNRYKITEAFVKHLLSQTYKDIKLVLVDDGSTDGTADMVKSLMPDSVILTGDGNLWWGGGLHLAFKWLKDNAADDDIIWFANDDTDFADDYCEKALELMKKERLVTGYGISKQTGELVDCAVDFDFPAVEETFLKQSKAYGVCASTRSFFIHGADMRKTGGFHPKLLPHYGSDYEWTIRACRKCDAKIYCTEELSYYVNEATTGYHDVKEQSLKMILSKKSMSNPFYKISFAFLSAPFGKKFASCVKQGIRMLKKI